MVFVLNPAAIAELVREPAGTTEVSDGGMGREMYKDRGHFCAHGKNKTTVPSLIPTLYLASFPHCTLPHSQTTSLIPRPPPALFRGYNYWFNLHFFYSGWPLEVVCELCKAAPSWTPGNYLADLHQAIASTIEVWCPVAADWSRVFLHRFWQKFLLKRNKLHR